MVRKYYDSPCLVDIAVTNRCNLKCDYCSAESGPFASKEGEMTVDELNQLFMELNSMNVHRVALTGGEPFARKDMLSIIENFNKYNFSKVLNTNGTLITDNIAHQLSKFNLDRICVTIDSYSPEGHDCVRGRGSFKKAIKGIIHLQRYNLPVSTLFTLNKNNVNDLIKTIRLNDLLGIEHMSVMVVCPTGRASDASILTDKENWYPVFLELSELMKSNEFNVNFKIVPPNESDIFWTHYFPLAHYGRLDLLSAWGQDLVGFSKPSKREISCQAGVKACSISHQGNVYGCDLMNGIEELIAGNVKIQKFREIWNDSEVFKKLREISFDSISGKCSLCPHEWCGGGCRCTALELDGSLYGSDLTCFWNESEVFING